MDDRVGVSVPQNCRSPRVARIPLFAVPLALAICVATSRAQTASVDWPLTVSPGGRYLVQDDGKPFFYLCDTAWNLLRGTTDDQMRLYLQDRASKGFTVIHYAVLWGKDPASIDAALHPEPALLDRAVAIVAEARQLGFTCNLVLAWQGYAGKGWARAFREMDEAQVRQFTRMMAARFQPYDNVIYSLGGDINPEEADIRVADWQGDELSIVDPDKPVMFFSSVAASSARWFHDRDWLDFNFIEMKARKPESVDDPTSTMRVIEDYHRTPVRPTHLGEWHYEYEYEVPKNWPIVTAHHIRRSAWQSVLSGAMGYTYGRRGLWHFNDPADYPVTKPWTDLLSCEKSPGGCSMSHLAALYRSIEWWRLVPSHAQPFAVKGEGRDTIDFIASAVADNGSFALVYFPASREVSLDLSRLAGPEIEAVWFDPSSGERHASRQSIEPGTVESFRPPGVNAEGSGDWVLLLRSIPGGESPGSAASATGTCRPGSIGPT